MSFMDDAVETLTAGAKGAATGAALGPIGAVGGAALGLALHLVPDLAKVLGRDATATDRIVKTVEQVTGSKDPVAQQAALAEPGLEGDLRVQLAQIATDHEQAMEEARVDAFKASLAASIASASAAFSDTLNARLRDIQIRQSGGGRNVRADVMIAMTIIGIVACLGVTIYGKVEGNSAIFGLVAGLVGVFSKCFADAFSFEFGSSAGSARKTELMAQREPIPPNPGVIVPAADVQSSK